MGIMALPLFARHRKKLIWVIAALAVAGVIFAGYKFVENLLEDYAAAKQKLGVLETAIEVQNTTIEQQQDALQEWVEAQERMKQQLEALNARSAEAREEASRLRFGITQTNLEILGASELGVVANGISLRNWCLLEAATRGSDGSSCTSGDSEAQLD